MIMPVKGQGSAGQVARQAFFPEARWPGIFLRIQFEVMCIPRIHLRGTMPVNENIDRLPTWSAPEVTQVSIVNVDLILSSPT